MPIPWGQHLDLARCAASIGELDLGAATVAMAAGLHLLQRDLLIDSWTDNDPLLRKQLLSAFANGRYDPEIANKHANTVKS